MLHGIVRHDRIGNDDRFIVEVVDGGIAPIDIFNHPLIRTHLDIVAWLDHMGQSYLNTTEEIRKRILKTE